MTKITTCLASCASLMIASIAPLSAQTVNEKISFGDARKEVALTIYNEDLALVREIRDLDLDKGLNHFALRDVSGMIRPETAIMTTANNTKLNVLEQNFNFNLLSPDTLLNKYIGNDVTIVTRNEDGSQLAEKATLLANKGGIILKYADRIEIGAPKDAQIKFNSLPQNLRDRPTLVTDIMSEETGKKEVNIAYLSGGFGWKADYVAELNKDENKISLKGWVTLQNNSGTNYENAKLQLVAGYINRSVSKTSTYGDWGGDWRDSDVKFVEKNAEQETFFDYHLYTLPNTTTLNNNQIKQVALMNANDVPVVKHYIVDPLNSSNKYYEPKLAADDEGQRTEVGVYFDFDNNKQSHLGMPLPKGTLRAYKPDSKSNALFIGEDNIDHSTEGAHLRLKFGNAFDIKAYVKTIDAKTVGQGLVSSSVKEYTNQIIVKNAKDEAVVVEVPVRFSNDWEILEESAPHEKINSQHIVWKIKVDPKSDVKLTYKSREQ